MNTIKKFLVSIKPKIQNKSDYEGLITVFAIMLTVEYTSDIYDLWDTLFGLLAFYIGCFVYLNTKLSHEDNFYKLLASSLTSLGAITILYSLLTIINILPDMETPLISNIKLLFFIIFISFIYKYTNNICKRINNILDLKEDSKTLDEK